MEQFITIKREPRGSNNRTTRQSTFGFSNHLLSFTNFKGCNNNLELLGNMTATADTLSIKTEPEINQIQNIQINQSQPTLDMLQNHLLNTNFESTRANFELMNFGLNVRNEVSVNKIGESSFIIRNQVQNISFHDFSHKLGSVSANRGRKNYSLLNDNNTVCTQSPNNTSLNKINNGSFPLLRSQVLGVIEDETSHKRRLRLARENVKRWRDNLSLEAVVKLREGNRKRKAERRRNQSEEQRLLALYEDKMRKRIRREEETPEERLQRQIEDQKRHVMQRITETPEQRCDRLMMDQKRAALRRTRETEEERMRRLLADKQRKAHKRANETSVERIRRLTDARERIAAKRKGIRGNSDNRETSDEETSDDEFAKHMTEPSRKTLEWLVKINNEH